MICPFLKKIDRFNRCKLEKNGKVCECGMRWKTEYLITGHLLKIWPALRSILDTIQVVRVPRAENRKIIGILVNESEAGKLIELFDTEPVV